MIYILQLCLFCGLFTLFIVAGTRGKAENALFFYPKVIQDAAVEKGMTTHKEIKRKKICLMIPFYLVMFTVLILIVGLWNQKTDFISAFLQSALFLVVMNWFDGIVIDKIWVGYSSFWRIKELEGIPYVPTWKQVLIKRGICSILFILVAVIPAGIIVILF